MKEYLYLPYDYLKNRILGKNQIKNNLGILLDILPQAPVILEAGAFNGADTLSMHYAWPKGQIHAFEPVPETFNLLKSRSRFIKSIHIYNVALADKTGSFLMNVSSGKSAASSSLLEPQAHRDVYPDVEFESKIKINTISLDEWSLANNVERIDFMWLDMQGFELFALKSGLETLSKVKAIYMEVSVVELYSASPLYPEVRQWMESKGFKVLREDLNEVDGNVLFVKNDEKVR
jgi:2-O-methyltransferase